MILKANLMHNTNVLTSWQTFDSQGLLVLILVAKLFIEKLLVLILAWTGNVEENHPERRRVKIKNNCKKCLQRHKEWGCFFSFLCPKERFRPKILIQTTSNKVVGLACCYSPVSKLQKTSNWGNPTPLPSGSMLYLPDSVTPRSK